MEADRVKVPAAPTVHANNASSVDRESEGCSLFNSIRSINLFIALEGH